MGSPLESGFSGIYQESVVSRDIQGCRNQLVPSCAGYLSSLESEGSLMLQETIGLFKNQGELGVPISIESI